MIVGGGCRHNLFAFSPDGQRLARPGANGAATVEDVATGTVPQTLAGHDGRLDAAAFSSDGTRLATASQDHAARVGDLSTGEVLFTLTAMPQTEGSGSCYASFAWGSCKVPWWCP